MPIDPFACRHLVSFSHQMPRKDSAREVWTMGYYCTVEVDFRIKKERVDAFLAHVNVLRQQKDHPAWLFFEVLELEDRWITFADYCAKWRNTEDFAKCLAPFAEAGCL